MSVSFPVISQKRSRSEEFCMWRFHGYKERPPTLELWEVCIVVPSGSQFPAPWALTASSRTKNTHLNQSLEKCNRGRPEGPLNKKRWDGSLRLRRTRVLQDHMDSPLETFCEKANNQTTENWNQMEREMSLKPSGRNVLLVCVCLARFSVACLITLSLIVQKKPRWMFGFVWNFFFFFFLRWIQMISDFCRLKKTKKQKKKMIIIHELTSTGTYTLCLEGTTLLWCPWRNARWNQMCGKHCSQTSSFYGEQIVQLDKSNAP